MSRIHILSPSLANKIAAGEVVERPASVIKELMENAIDAGGKNIRVDIDGGGKTLMRVLDDGCGMTLEEATLSIERHATSKIYEESDLFRIETLGFRGEALPSIASVSHLTLSTKSKESSSLEGAFLEMRGGEMIASSPKGVPAGTEIVVRDLFFNTPARLKFLKSDAVESARIQEMFLRLSLGFLDCRFDLYASGRLKMSCPVIQDPLQRVAACLGKNFAKDAIEIFEEQPEIQLRGWLIHPSQTTSNPQSIYFYLNGRFLKDRLLQHALIDGFQDYLMKRHYPKAILYLKMNPNEVDVNVHPAKKEVRFSKPQAVHQFVASAVRKALQRKIYVGMESEYVAKSFQKEEVQQAVARFYNARSKDLPTKKEISKPEPTTQSFNWGKGAFESLKLFGAFQKSYILCESPSGQLVLIDQHAAHERIGFEKLKQKLKEGISFSQRLLIPVPWEGSPSLVTLLREAIPLLASLGFEVEPFGGETLMIKAIPSLLSEKEIPTLLSKIGEELEKWGESRQIESKIEEILKTIACHAQVRANDFLSPEEMAHLLKEMDQFQATHCPHGRPTAVYLSMNEIAGWFKRT